VFWCLTPSTFVDRCYRFVCPSRHWHTPTKLHNITAQKASVLKSPQQKPPDIKYIMSWRYKWEECLEFFCWDNTKQTEHMPIINN
jgi:hypothetical protein